MTVVPEPAPGPRLVLRDFRAGYRGVAVVHGIDLVVEPREVVALLGPNGAGKTTTLLTVAGLLPLLGGEVEVLGSTPRRRRDALGLARGGVALVPEDRALFLGLTGREHLRLAAGRRDVAALDLALAPFPALAAVVDRRAGLMSGGEQQMLAIARALAARPQLLMIDELSLGLAPIVVQQLLPVLRDVARTTGAGVLLVEQHVTAALAVVDRAYVMVRGTIRAHGAAADLAADPHRIAQCYLGDGPA